LDFNDDRQWPVVVNSETSASAAQQLLSDCQTTAVGVYLLKAKLGNKKQSHYRPGVAHRVPGS